MASKKKATVVASTDVVVSSPPSDPAASGATRKRTRNQLIALDAARTTSMDRLRKLSHARKPPGPIVSRVL